MYSNISEELLQFIHKSPDCFHAVHTMEEMLEEEGYVELKENLKWEIQRGGKYFVNRNGSSLIAFTIPEGDESVVIHCASMVTTNPDFNQKLMDVNVGGTKNMIDMCLKHPECRKMVYVSSTGAIPEQPKGTPIRETYQFTPVDESRQVGCYSQSKALATQAVLDAFRERGLKACVVHPSGILGPKDYAVGETTGTVIKIMNGKMPVGMGGSFKRKLP